MTEIRAYPLQWPAGWRRIDKSFRQYGKFGVNERSGQWPRKRDLTVFEAIQRVMTELQRLGVERDDIVISTNLPTRIDGLPRSDARNPQDPGAAVYWRAPGQQPRCMAVDQYTTVADNLAAIAATLEAMRAIERHGGALILDRVFQGFTALPSPESWWQVLGLMSPEATRSDIEQAHRRLAMENHPDRGGDTDRMARINRARDMGLEAVA